MLRLQNAYKLHVPAFSNRSDSEAPAMETRYIRFASDYICNRDGLSFRGALITGLDPPRLLAFPPSLLPFAPFFLQCSPCRSTHHFSPWFPLVFAKQNTRWNGNFHVDAIRDSFSNENFLAYLLVRCNQLNEFSSTDENYQSNWYNNNNNNGNFIFLINISWGLELNIFFTFLCVDIHDVFFVWLVSERWPWWYYARSRITWYMHNVSHS